MDDVLMIQLNEIPYSTYDVNIDSNNIHFYCIYK